MSKELSLFNLKVGNQVTIKGWPPSDVLEVVDSSDPGLVVLQTPAGANLNVMRLPVTGEALVIFDQAGAKRLLAAAIESRRFEEQFNAGVKPAQLKR